MLHNKIEAEIEKVKQRTNSVRKDIKAANVEHSDRMNRMEVRLKQD